jgi:transposase-like protein
MSIRRRIAAALAEGGGVRPVARKFGVSPATVVEIRRTTSAHFSQEAA